MAAEFFGEDSPDVELFEPRIPCGELSFKPNGSFNQIFTLSHYQWQFIKKHLKTPSCQYQFATPDIEGSNERNLVAALSTNKSTNPTTIHYRFSKRH